MKFVKFITFRHYYLKHIQSFFKGWLQLKIQVVFTTKTEGEGSGQLLTSLWFFNRGPANY